MVFCNNYVVLLGIRVARWYILKPKILIWTVGYFLSLKKLPVANCPPTGENSHNLVTLGPDNFFYFSVAEVLLERRRSPQVFSRRRIRI
jgi:hypothetical protein